MKPKFRTAAFSASVALFVSITAFAADEHASGSPEMAVGRMGVKLGTIVTVEGIVIEGGKAEIPEGQNDNGSLFLRVERLDGRVLTPFVYLRVVSDPLVDISPNNLPKVSQRFLLRGYEGGYFTGSPSAVYNKLQDKTTPPPSGWGHFRFLSVFNVTEVLKRRQ